MIDRYVYRCRVNRRGELVAVCSHTAKWSPRSVRDVAEDIDSGRYRYLVQWETGVAEVTVRRTTDRRGREVPTIDAMGPDGSSGGLTELPRS